MSDNKKSSRVKKLKKSKRRNIIIGLVAIGVLGGLGVSNFNRTYIYNDEIAKNIFIEDIEVSNMSKEEAINAVSSMYAPQNISLMYGDKTYTISPKDIDLSYNVEEVVEYAYNYTKKDSYLDNVKAILKLKKSNEQFSIKSQYNEEKLNNIMNNIASSINVDMVNAKVYISNSGNISSSQSTTGKEMDVASNKEAVVKNLEDMVYDNIELKVKINEPKISTSQASSVNALLGEYTTKFSASDPARNHNIMVSARKSSDILLMPGEEFSYNSLTGMRTAKNGYKNAPVILNGKLIDALGGGVCQTSSTLFNPVLTSGLKITYRSNHSIASGYVPNGRDAMVNDAGTDFRFKNPYNHPVYIKNVVTSNSITSRVYGSSLDKQNITIKVDNYLENGLEAAKTYREYRDASGKIIKTEYISKSVYKELQK